MKYNKQEEIKLNEILKVEEQFKAEIKRLKHQNSV
jgi:hypothetical protein